MRKRKINLNNLRNQVEDCEANNILLLSLESHLKNKELIEAKLLDSNSLDTRNLISLSNSLNGVSKSINQCLTTLLYIQEESEDESLESLYNNMKGE